MSNKDTYLTHQLLCCVISWQFALQAATMDWRKTCISLLERMVMSTLAGRCNLTLLAFLRFLACRMQSQHTVCEDRSRHMP